MALQITRKKDTRVIRAFTHKLADIPNGVNVATADFTQTSLKEGTPVGKDSNGLYHIVKTATLAANASNSAITYTVKKGHNLKVGDFIFAVIGGKSYAITDIATNETDSTLDDITVGTTLGVALSTGAVLVQGAASGASAGAYKYNPVGLVGESYDVEALANRPANVVTIGQVKEACIPALGIVADALKGIVLI